jgi:predicted membrane protein
MKYFYGILCLIIATIISLNIAGLFVTNEYTATVTDKVVKNSKEHSKYLIFTEAENGDVRVFKDTDALFRGKFNSSDIYGEIKVGKTYQFKTYGFRIPFLSFYENITDVDKVKR